MLPTMQFAAPVIGPPDYDWETNGSSKGSILSDSSTTLGHNSSVSCVSLGSYCAVASCLTHLKLREAAFPLDWNRTTIQGVIHFLKTRFSDFLQFFLVKDFVGGKDTGGKAYCGVYHSVWHENLGSGDGQAKYQRRIERLYENKAERLLFIRSLNSSDELAAAQELLETLEAIFPDSRVYLLLIVTCQRESRQYFVSGLKQRLIVHFLPGWSIDGLAFSEAIQSAHRHASCDGDGDGDCGSSASSSRSKGGSRQSSCSSGCAANGSKAAGTWIPAETPMARVAQEMFPFYGGPPQHVPFNPEVPYFYPGFAPGCTPPGDMLQTAVSPTQGGYRAQPYSAPTGPSTVATGWGSVPWTWGPQQQQQQLQQPQQQQQQKPQQQQQQQQQQQLRQRQPQQQQQRQQQQQAASFPQQQQKQQPLASPLAPVAAVAPMLAQWAVKPAVATAAARHLGTSPTLPLPPPATGLAAPTEFAPTWAY